MTKTELKEALGSLGQHPGEEDINAMFREYDTNQNQMLDCSEFRRLIMAKLSYKVMASTSSTDYWIHVPAHN